MNWHSTSFDWNHAKAFLATVEEGSLSAAARALKLTQPTLGRQVSALEESLGLVLFERIGKSLVLTPSGLELAEYVRRMNEAANQMSLSASGQSQDIKGKVRITASDITAVYTLPPAIKHIRQIAPLIEIDIVAANDIQDLQLREADIAIRHVRPQEPDLIARLVAEGQANFYASTDYLDQHGRPASIDDMTKHDFIGFGDTTRMLEYLNPLGLSLTEQNFPLGSANSLVAWELIQHGLGIGIMPEKVAGIAPNIECLLPTMTPIIFPVWLVAHRELHTSARIRLVYDVLADFLAQDQ